MCRFPAEEVIKNWLRGVEGASHGKSRPPPAVAAAVAALEEPNDVIGCLDWSEGDIAENARSVVQSLLSKDLTSSSTPSRTHNPTHNQDPRVAMEIRHKRVSCT